LQQTELKIMPDTLNFVFIPREARRSMSRVSDGSGVVELLEDHPYISGALGVAAIARMFR
jgi:hypothetical protein